MGEYRLSAQHGYWINRKGIRTYQDFHHLRLYKEPFWFQSGFCQPIIDARYRYIKNRGNTRFLPSPSAQYSGFFRVSLWGTATRREKLLRKMWFHFCNPLIITFSEKEWLKKQKIADLGFYFEFQVVVAVVGFKWRSWGNAKMADLRSRNAFKSLPQRNSLISIFNGFGFYFSILHRLWICHATLMI